MIVIDIAIPIVATAVVLATVRMVRGPHTGDRAIAADLVFFSFIALLALIGFRIGSPFVYDIVVVATLVGLVSALSLGRLMSGGRR